MCDCLIPHTPLSLLLCRRDWGVAVFFRGPRDNCTANTYTCLPSLSHTHHRLISYHNHNQLCKNKTAHWPEGLGDPLVLMLWNSQRQNLFINARVKALVQTRGEETFDSYSFHVKLIIAINWDQGKWIYFPWIWKTINPLYQPFTNNIISFPEMKEY